MNDSFLLQEKRFSIVGVNGSGLFNPLSYTMRPLPRITSCWRGYVCTYKTLASKMVLDTLLVNLDQEGPAINNVRPAFTNKETFNNIYNDLDLHMDFTGGILLAHGFIQQLYVHMGFHPAWKYETVYELSISQGDVLETKDISAKMAELRNKMTRWPLAPDAGASKQEIEKWIASTFKRDYRF